MAMRQRTHGVEIVDVHSRDHDLRYTGVSSSLHDVVPVGVELRRIEVAVGVDPAGHSSNDARIRVAALRARHPVAW
jgi:hypothetical protein